MGNVSKNYKGRLVDDYEGACWTIAHRVRLGKDALVQKSLKLGAEEIYHITITSMWEDVLRVLKRTYPCDLRRLEFLRRLQAKGIKEYYSFEFGKLTIDKSIETQTKILSRYPESIRG